MTTSSYASLSHSGKAMLNRMHHLAQNNENFAFETTLASRSFAPWIVKLKKEKDYLFHLTFLMLKDPDLAVLRVAERVKMGGHFVPKDTISRRFHVGLKNFFNLYLPLADSWQMYDNSEVGNPTSIASKINNRLDITNQVDWSHLMEQYNET
jgi:predicted ABC-type ATPase